MNDQMIIVESPGRLSVADDIESGLGDLPLDTLPGQSKAASDQSNPVKPDQSESKSIKPNQSEPGARQDIGLPQLTFYGRLQGVFRA